MAHASMDHQRRLRSPTRRSSSPPSGDQHHHRFLRPGALARLRDSKVMARSLRSAAAAMALPVRLHPPSSSPPSTRVAAAGDGGGVPHFLGAVRGPRYPLRKKLSAARIVVFLPPPLTDVPDVFLDAFVAAPSDLLAAH
ncbi:hypothetical protein GUJ93_ZPchr0006g42914 [Zizania palustris]|uniref:Uncharacterized protein n=1 Tax=Zizania palustris TaxID=103762 RepID=A0A8J5TB14_ZIZPA|nr:hypothetical protein GUJ93_ZPchr0006g42914 [Zizania palustris]